MSKEKTVSAGKNSGGLMKKKWYLCRLNYVILGIYRIYGIQGAG